MITYLLLYGYPSDKVVIPIIAVIIFIAIKIAFKEIVKDLRGEI